MLLVVLVLLLSGCAGAMMGDDWQAAQASGEQARAGAEWAHTAQVQAESAAAVREAPTRAAAQTAGIVALLVVGVGVAAGCGAALVLWSWRRASLVFADKSGLYPLVAGRATLTSGNEDGAQHARITGRPMVRVLPPAEVEAVPAIPAPIILDAKQLQHIERLLLPAGSVDYDTD
jgi:hypothetical protein